MPVDADANERLNERLKELIAKIETEQNPKEFSVLVEELNRLLERGPSMQVRPAPQSCVP